MEFLLGIMSVMKDFFWGGGADGMLQGLSEDQYGSQGFCLNKMSWISKKELYHWAVSQPSEGQQHSIIAVDKEVQFEPPTPNPQCSVEQT